MKTKPFKLLRERMTPEQQAESAAQAQLYLTHLALQELRQSLDITQEELAQQLGINQSTLSSFENQETIELATLSRYIHALGGKLKIVASFPDKEVLLSQSIVPQYGDA